MTMHTHPMFILGILDPTAGTRECPVDSEAFEMTCLLLAAAAQPTLMHSWTMLIV